MGQAGGAWFGTCIPGADMKEKREFPKPGVEVIRPPGLASKVPSFGGRDPVEAMRRMEQVIQSVAAEFATTIPEELDTLDGLLGDFRRDHSAETLDKIFRRIHNLRGQGSTMGFPLITRIGTSFCKYMVERDTAKAVNADLIEQHLQALRIVLRERKAGNGDELAAQVAAALEMAVKKELG